LHACRKHTIHQGDALGQAGAAIACQLPQVRQASQLLGPGVAVAVVRQAARQPAQAVLFHHHQTRPAAEEDLIGRGLFDPRSGDGVEERQQGVGLVRRRVCPPP